MAPPAAGSPIGYVNGNTQHVLYRSKAGDLVELLWKDGGWSQYNLTSACSDTPPLEPDLVGGIFQDTHQVVYCDSDSYLNELSWDGGCHVRRFLSNVSQQTVRTPDGVHIRNQSFELAEQVQGLTLPAMNTVAGSLEMNRILARTPSAFAVLPDSIVDFRGNEPFFFQDLRRTFFVEPPEMSLRKIRQRPKWVRPDEIPLDIPRLRREIKRAISEPLNYECRSSQGPDGFREWF